MNHTHFGSDQAYSSDLQSERQHEVPHLSSDTYVHRLQTVLHSILSTRVVLHTATVLRKDIVESEATVAQNRGSNSMRFAEVTIELVPEDAEDQETRRQNNMP